MENPDIDDKLVHAHEAAEGAVMGDEAVGDRADDNALARPEARVEQILEPNDLGRPVGIGLVVHAVIGGEGHHGAEGLEGAVSERTFSMAKDYFPEIALVSEVAIRQAIVYAYRTLGILCEASAAPALYQWAADLCNGSHALTLNVNDPSRTMTFDNAAAEFSAASPVSARAKARTYWPSMPWPSRCWPWD